MSQFWIFSSERRTILDQSEDSEEEEDVNPAPSPMTSSQIQDFVESKIHEFVQSMKDDVDFQSLSKEEKQSELRQYVKDALTDHIDDLPEELQEKLFEQDSISKSIHVT